MTRLQFSNIAAQGNVRTYFAQMLAVRACLHYRSHHGKAIHHLRGLAGTPRDPGAHWMGFSRPVAGVWGFGAVSVPTRKRRVTKKLADALRVPVSVLERPASEKDVA